jgi:hypothetical protein
MQALEAPGMGADGERDADESTSLANRLVGPPRRDDRD